MASYSIEHRKLVSGESRYRSQVVIKKGGRIIHREQKTFRKKAHAVEYGKRRVFELEAEGVNKLLRLASLSKNTYTMPTYGITRAEKSGVVWSGKRM